MTCSPARLAANRANALRSKGPITPEGKAISRRNAYKHGLAGSGVVITDEDSAEVDRRNAALLVELGPKTVIGRYQAGRIAELTVQAEGCSKHRRASTALRMAHAGEAFDEARIAEVDHALGWIAAEPATHARKLRSMPEGVDRMISKLLDLRAELENGRWSWVEGEHLANLTGVRYLEIPVTRVRAYSEAIDGEFRNLNPGEGAGLDDMDRRLWAREQLFALIDREVEMLLAHRETLDFEAIEADRAGAADRARFDPSKEGILARRYEAAAERGVLKAIRELERAEAAARAQATEVEATGPVEAAEEAEAGGPVGSFRAGHPREVPPAHRPFHPASTEPQPAADRLGEGREPLRNRT